MQPNPTFFVKLVDWLQETLKSNDEAVPSFVALRDKQRGDDVYREWVSQMLCEYKIPEELEEAKTLETQVAKKAVRKIAMELSSTLPLIAATYIHLESIQHTDLVAWMKDETEQDAAEAIKNKKADTTDTTKDKRDRKTKTAIHEKDHFVIIPELLIFAEPDENSSVVGSLIVGQSLFSTTPHTFVGDQTWAEVKSGFVKIADGHNKFVHTGPRTLHFYDIEKGTAEFAAKTNDLINWIQNYVNNAPTGVTFGRLGAVLANGVYSKIAKSSGGCRALLGNHSGKFTLSQQPNSDGGNIELTGSEIPTPIPAADNSDDSKILRTDERKVKQEQRPVQELQRPGKDLGPILPNEPMAMLHQPVPSFSKRDPITGAIPQPPTQPQAQASLSDLLDADINDVTNRAVQPPPASLQLGAQPNGGNHNRREARVRTCNNWKGVPGSCRFGEGCTFPHPLGQPPSHQPQHLQLPQQPMLQVPHGQPMLMQPIPQQQGQRVGISIPMQPMQQMPNHPMQLPPISPEVYFIASLLLLQDKFKNNKKKQEMRSRQILDSLINAQRERKRQLAGATQAPLKRHSHAPILS